MKEFIKKNWWVFIVCALCFFAAWMIKQPKNIVVQDNAVALHRIDSLSYKKSSDSLVQIIDTLKSRLAKKKIQYITVVRGQGEEMERVTHLMTTETIKEYADRVDDSCKMVVINRDTSVITPINGIKTAVVLLLRGEQCLERETVTGEQSSLREAIIKSQGELIVIKDNRIIGLTKEFYSSQLVISGLRGDVEREKKKNRIKNILLGSVAGVAAVGILVAVLK